MGHSPGLRDGVLKWAAHPSRSPRSHVKERPVFPARNKFGRMEVLHVIQYCGQSAPCNHRDGLVT